MATLRIERLVKRYGPVTAVAGIDLAVADREFVVLVGPSGCGKSTTLRMIAGLEEVTDGEIWIGERLVNELEPKDRDIAMVFQDYALYPHMSVFENMAFGLRYRRYAKAEIRRRVADAAQILGIEPLLGQAPEAALGRPAPARRDGPRDRARPRGLPLRRAALEPRRQAPRADAHRDQAPAPAGLDHRGLRHPRPGRGDDARRPHRDHARRPDRAGRHARRDLQRARSRPTSRASSARRP